MERTFQHGVPLLRRSSARRNSTSLLALRQAVAHGGERSGLEPPIEIFQQSRKLNAFSPSEMLSAQTQCRLLCGRQELLSVSLVVDGHNRLHKGAVEQSAVLSGHGKIARTVQDARRLDVSAQ